MDSPARTTLDPLPPSSKLVFKALEWNGTQTQKQLAEETMMSPRTVRDALTRLEDAGLITERINIRDARQNLYSLQIACEAEATAD